MNNKVIISNLEFEDLKNICQIFVDQYAGTVYDNGLRINKIENKEKEFLIDFPVQPDFDRFCYLVNFIHYPAQHESVFPKVYGWYIPNKTVPQQFQSSKGLLVFVSKDDKAYDNVNVMTDPNGHFIYDFGGRIKQLKTLEEKYGSEDFERTSIKELAIIYPEKNSRKKKWWEFW